MPVIWLIDAYRAGERGQVRALADALGWPCETKTLRYRKHVVLPHVLGRTTLRGIDAGSAASLQAPWPDLVISSGVRNEPVCRWIREQSGGRARYVHVGRPWASLDSFDLVITTPQYRVPEESNVVNNTLTLHSITPERLAQARRQWAPTFEALPRPRIAVIVGGDSGPFTFGAGAAARLGREVSQLAIVQEGSLMVSTSSRTRPAAVAALKDHIRGPHYFYPWKSGDPANPYMGILSWADRLVVTADSIAMLSEACATGKPVRMFDLGGMRAEPDRNPRDFRLGGVLYGFMIRWLWKPLSRDITLVHARLRGSGGATWSDELLGTARRPAQTDMQHAVDAVRQLLDQA